MSMSGLHHKLLGNRYLAIEHFTFESKDYTALVYVEKKQGSLEIIDQKLEFDDGQVKSLYNKLPHYITVNNSQVIHKVVEGNDPVDEKLVYKAFPNVLIDEFYYEVWRLKTRSIVAICRKNYVESILQNYVNRGAAVAGIALGLSPMSEIISFLNQNEWQTNSYGIEIATESATLHPNQELAKQVYEINGISINSQSLLGFASILRFFGKKSTTGSILERNADLFEKFEQEQLFSASLKIFISFLLVVLVANFLTFSHYFNKNETATLDLASKQSAVELNRALESRVRIKEQKLKGFTNSGNASVSSIVNSITSIVPTSVLLNELSFSPLQKKVKAGESIATDDKIIVISGIVSDNNKFTDWVEKTGRIQAVSRVTILKFGKDEENQTNFSIKIALR